MYNQKCHNKSRNCGCTFTSTPIRSDWVEMVLRHPIRPENADVPIGRFCSWIRPSRFSLTFPTFAHTFNRHLTSSSLLSKSLIKYFLVFITHFRCQSHSTFVLKSKSFLTLRSTKVLLPNGFFPAFTISTTLIFEHFKIAVNFTRTLYRRSIQIQWAHASTRNSFGSCWVSTSWRAFIAHTMRTM